jgi:hypothetical protein
MGVLLGDRKMVAIGIRFEHFCETEGF